MDCQVCTSDQAKIFYKQKKVPVLNNVTYSSYQEAVACLKQGVTLSYCNNCGLIFNSMFDANLTKYDQSYDSYRSCSFFYSSYIDNLIKLLIRRYKIKNKKILEIGCFDGGFLKLLCQQSESSGVGFDPAYDGLAKIGKVKFIKDYFPSEKYDEIKADICILRHVLEHVESPAKFLKTILDKVRFDKDLTIIIEVPDFDWIAKEGTFWDVTYEHCNYFTKHSLTNLLRLVGADKIESFNTFGEQYLVMTGVFPKFKRDKNLEKMLPKEIIKVFLKNIATRKKGIRKVIYKSLEPFSIWGMSGKGVIFTNLLPKKIQKRIPYVIDDSLKKQYKYSAGTGYKILPHHALKSHTVNKILIMNQNYYQEMSKKIKKIGKRIPLVIV